MITTAVIIAGGAGSRMGHVTEDLPKTMVPVAGKPILYWILNWLKSHGIKKVVIGVAYKKEKIIDYVKKNSFGLDIKISEHTVEGETGEAFRLAITRFVKDDNFAAMNGDELTNLDLSKVMAQHEKAGKAITVVLAPFQPLFSIAEVDKAGLLSSFEYKPVIRDKFISCGIYVFNKAIVPFLPQKGSIERTAFIELTKKKQAAAYLMAKDEWWATVNNTKELAKAEEMIKKAWLDY